MSEARHPGGMQLLNHSLGLPIDEAILRHIQGCPVCRREVESLVQERASFDEHLQAELRFEDFQQRQRQAGAARGSGWLHWVPAVGAVLLLVIGLGVAWFARPLASRLKGSVGINLYVKRDGQVVRVEQTFHYRRSDKIRLGILTPQPVRVTVLAEQAGGFEPIPDLADIPVQPGIERMLPGSLTLDCHRDSETLRIQFREAAGGGEPDTRVIVLECERP